MQIPKVDAGPGITLHSTGPNRRMDYANTLREAMSSGETDGAGVAAYLAAELPYHWADEYRVATPRLTLIERVQLGTFEYIYDDLSTLEALGTVPDLPDQEARLVAAIGYSSPTSKSRKPDDRRLRGFVGPTEAVFGDDRDKGHFIAHEIGGWIAGAEFNTFSQLRSLNRGWSAEGKVYRSMETYGRLNAGTLCFSRPLYADGSAVPARLEFGVLRGPDDLWVEVLANR